MKRLNKKGFTLIELLAVIVIMGVLMIVAIPAVSRTIENARRDSFADTAKEYINAVRNAVLADNISCGGIVASATSAGDYYYGFDTTGALYPAENASDLMETGGKSPFGNAEIAGIVQWHKDIDAATGKTTTTYQIQIRDSSGHGWAALIPESDIARSRVTTNVANVVAGAGTECRLN